MKAGRAMRDAGLRFLYHVHGYEFQQGPDGTLFDALAKQTEAGVVDFQMDVFWVVHGGGNPVDAVREVPGTLPVHAPEGHEKGHQGGRPDAETRRTTRASCSATGWSTSRASFGAANKAGVKIHFIEDEHPQSEKQIPRSLEYLASLKL